MSRAGYRIRGLNRGSRSCMRRVRGCGRPCGFATGRGRRGARSATQCLPGRAVALPSCHRRPGSCAGWWRAPDLAYGARRTGAFTVAVKCAEQGETFFAHRSEPRQPPRSSQDRWAPRQPSKSIIARRFERRSRSSRPGPRGRSAPLRTRFLHEPDHGVHDHDQEDHSGVHSIAHEAGAIAAPSNI